MRLQDIQGHELRPEVVADGFEGGFACEEFWEAVAFMFGFCQFGPKPSAFQGQFVPALVVISRVEMFAVLCPMSHRHSKTFINR